MGASMTPTVNPAEVLRLARATVRAERNAEAAGKAARAAKRDAALKPLRRALTKVFPIKAEVTEIVGFDRKKRVGEFAIGVNSGSWFSGLSASDALNEADGVKVCMFERRADGTLSTYGHDMGRIEAGYRDGSDKLVIRASFPVSEKVNGVSKGIAKKDNERAEFGSWVEAFEWLVLKAVAWEVK